MRSGPNSRFLRDFFAQNGVSVQYFVRDIYFLEQSDEKIRGRNAKFRAPEFFFRGSEFLFRGSDGKIPVQKLFHGGFEAVFPSRWNFFPETFPVSFCRRNPPMGFPAGRVSAPGVSRAPSKGQVWRGFRDILISARRVWLRSFRTVPARWPDTRISKGENEQIVNAHPNVFILSMEGCARGRISFLKMLTFLFYTKLCRAKYKDMPLAYVFGKPLRVPRIRKSAPSVAPEFQIRRSVSAGKCETVPRYISTAPIFFRPPIIPRKKSQENLCQRRKAPETGSFSSRKVKNCTNYSNVKV